MSTEASNVWLDTALENHGRLTEAVVVTMRNVLRDAGINFIAVTGRTKDRKSVLEKIKRKNYTNPASQLTDLSGIRVVVFIESDVTKVTQLIRETFRVDEANSSNKDAVLSTNQIGYRSVHFVCDLGPTREKLREHKGLAGLKFEFQVRTVLQHAWAELAHDRSYKLSIKLPNELDRKLNLYAGLLELADRGFDEIARAVDDYVLQLAAASKSDQHSTDINTLSLKHFFSQFAKHNELVYDDTLDDDRPDILVQELSDFKIHTIAALASLEPTNYVKYVKESQESTTTHSIVRDWMVIHDWKRYVKDVQVSWNCDEEEDVAIYRHYFKATEISQLRKAFRGAYNRSKDEL